MLLTGWLAIPLAFWIAFYIFTKGRLTRHVGFLHYVVFFFSIYIGSLSLYYEGGRINQWYLASVMMYPALAFLGMVFGCIVARRSFFPLVSTIRMWRRDVRLVSATVLLFLAVYGVYLYALGSNIPLVVLLTSGDAVEGRVARFAATKGYGEVVGGAGSLVWFPRILIDYYAAFVIVFAYIHMKRGYLSRSTFGLLMTGFLLMSVLDSQKYPALKLIVVLALCAYNYRFARVNWRSGYSALKAALAGMLVVGLIYAVVSGQGPKVYGEGAYGGVANAMEFGWEMMTSRGIVGQSKPLYTTYEVVPSKYGFFLGRTLANPRGLLPYQAVPLPYLICDEYGVETPGVRCGAPTVFFGEVYANFGIAISWLSMFLFGFILQVVNSKLSERIERDATPFSIASFYLIMTYVADYAISFVTPYFDERLWFFVLYYLSHRVIRGGFARDAFRAGRGMGEIDGQDAVRE